jgi:hypothetical protein
MDAFAIWKREVDAGQERIENTIHTYPEAEQYERMDRYWVGVLRNIQLDDPDATRKIRFIRSFADSGEYPLTLAALRSRVPLDAAPSVIRMKREIGEAADDLRARRTPPLADGELANMMDGKLTNYISDFRKDDPDYDDKKKFFKDWIWTGLFPNAAAMFERKGHGVPYSMERIQEEAVAARQQHLDNDARAQTSPAAGVPWTVGPGGRRTRRRGGKPPKPATVVVSNPIASLPRPPKPNPAAGTGLFPGGRKKTKKNRRKTRRSRRHR